MTTPAGWYPDPSNAAQQRYWDGNQWTEHVHPPVAAAAVAAEASPDALAAQQYADQQYAAQQYAAQQYAEQAQPATFDPSAGVGGLYTDLLTDQRYAEVGSGERVVLQNAKLLKVVLGEDLLARQGSMVAFQGQMDFDHEGSGAGRFLKKALTGEGLALMRCTGRGELFLADGAKNIHIIHLDNAGLSVNGRNVLAFEPSLQWDIERVQGASMLAGGLFNTRLQGRGWVAITTKGEPVVLRTDQPTFVDTDAVVAWSAGLSTTLNKTIKAKALIGKGSGEAAQLAFQGTGIVIVQPSEGDGVAPHTH